MPLLHYIVVGERSDRPPNDWFSPLAYWRLYPEVRRSSYGALEHFIRFGRQERRHVTIPSASSNLYEGSFPAVVPWKRTSRFAVVVHLYFPRGWRRISENLACTLPDADVIVTIPDLRSHDLVARSVATSNAKIAAIVRCPNVGRDILPFVHLVNSGHLDGYDAIVKLHSKRSRHLEDGEIWFEELVDGLLPQGRTQDLIDALLTHPSAEIAVPKRYLFEGEEWWGRNRDRTIALFQRTAQGRDIVPLRFAAGSMFWITSSYVRRIKDLALCPTQFEIEIGQLDATMAHSLERLFGMLAGEDGLISCEALGIETNRQSRFQMLRRR